MKILFLDIDGVLNSRIYDMQRDWRVNEDIDVSRLPLLKQITEATGARIVLSSTWRSGWNAENALCNEGGRYINRTLASFGLTIFDKTPYIERCTPRVQEISAWLKSASEPVEAFAILDDDPKGWAELSEFVVLTNPRFGLGLEEEHVVRAISLLGRK